jgi:hypothetical protein
MKSGIHEESFRKALSLGFPSEPYGNRLQPILPGGGGGSNGRPGFNGGGVVRLNAPIIAVRGTIKANGESAANDNGGAGAGGSIILEARKIAGQGTIEANGGNGLWSRGMHEDWYGISGGGGGGRILVLSDTSDTLLAISQGGSYGGRAGSVTRIQAGSQINEQLIVDAYDTMVIESHDDVHDGMHVSVQGGVLIINGKHQFSSLTLVGGAILTHAAADSAIPDGMEIEIAGLIAIDSTSRIDATGKGFSGATDSRCAQTVGFVCGSGGASGGSYGGLGGSVLGNSGNIYGSIIEPHDCGSGGSGNDLSLWHAGRGGGRVSIRAAEMHLDGTIKCDGQDGTNAGGGSGGSILIRCDTIIGQGMISAGGGVSNGAGGGAGGRIALYCGMQNDFQKNHVSANGALGKDLGRAGTIYLGKLDTTITNGTISITDLPNFVIDNRSDIWEDADIVLKNSSVVLNGELKCRSLVMKSSILAHDSPHSSRDSGLIIAASDSIVIDSRSAMDVSGKGYSGGTDSTCALTIGFACGSTGMSGGSYGGIGGNYTGAAEDVYGDYHYACNFGSGGAASIAGGHGGAGGGRIALKTPFLRIDGALRAKGENANCGGAGSGGAIMIDAELIYGNGWIAANGGHSAQYGQCGAGGGGGGRIVVKQDSKGFDIGHFCAIGGWGASDGQAGTVYLAYLESLVPQSHADTVIIFSDTVTISSDDITYENRSIMIANGGFKPIGKHTFRSIELKNSFAEFNDTITALEDIALLLIPELFSHCIPTIIFSSAPVNLLGRKRLRVS